MTSRLRLKALKKKQSDNLTRHNNKLAIWSQFNSDELGSTLRPEPSQHMIDQKAEAILIQFEQAYQEGRTYQEQIGKVNAKIIGAQAVKSHLIE